MNPVTARTKVPRRIWLYVAGTALLALILLPLSRLSTGSAGGLVALCEALALATVIASANRRPVGIGLKRKISVSTAPGVAAILLLPGPLAVLTLVVGCLAGEIHRRVRPVQLTFNSGVAAVRAAAGSLVLAAVLRTFPAAIADPLGAVAAAIAMYVSGWLLVLGITGVQLRENPLRRMWATPRDTLIAEATLSLTGIMAALATAQHPWALALLIAPATIAHYALRDGVALRAQTRLALEDLADIVDMRDHYTFEHSRRVAELARATARRLGLSHADVEQITMAGRVHDVGKIGVKSSVLMKPGGLTDPEWQEMRSHPEVGARLIANFPQFAKGRELVLHHHERYDGKGYPLGLAGEGIPYGARVLAVADAWDAMTSHRAYRKALDLGHVYAELERGRGKQFDPLVLDAFLAVLVERPDLAVAHTATAQDTDEAPVMSAA